VAAEDSVNPLIDQAAQMVRQSRSHLLHPSPANVYLCADSLAVANSCMESVRTSQTATDCPANRTALLALRQEIAAVDSLLAKAASFHGDLLHSMQSRATSTASGPPATTYTRFRVEA
jgi:hypothetical protein